MKGSSDAPPPLTSGVGSPDHGSAGNVPLPIVAGVSAGAVTPRDGCYVFTFPSNRKMILSAKDRLSVTGAETVSVDGFFDGAGIQDANKRGELAFPEGGFITFREGGFFHVKGFPKFAPPRGCRVTIPAHATVYFYADGDVNSDDEPAGEAWADIIRAFDMPVTDEEVSLPATDGCGNFKHTVGDTGVLDGPFTVTLGDGSVITAPSHGKTMYLVGARSLSRSLDTPDDVTDMDFPTDFPVGGSIILGEGASVCIPGVLVLQAKTGCLVNIPPGGAATLSTEMDDIQL